ncbi:MAG: hypothetical protein EAX96_11230 [Candidatus Lokiarchaeota archaeon]|nr:hypothetical protein [Candidatus Lokiarchaeota archaeon]
MEKKVLMKENLSKFINLLMEFNDVYAPVKKDNNLSYQKITNPDEIYLKFLNTKIPPKSIFFPQKEVLFKYEKINGEIKLSDTFEKSSSKIVFAIRPCDARSFKLLDNFFAFGEFKDKLYMERRKNSIIIGLGCNHPRSTCFCTSVKGSPFNKEDTDIFFTDLGDRYLVESITDSGVNIIKNLNVLRDALNDEIIKAEVLSKKVIENMKDLFAIEVITQNLDEIYDNKMWKLLGDTCIGCGTCSFLCPTCHCFDVIDENINKNKGQRVRLWDTCQFPLFTLHGSGHNPRPEKKERIRQRIYHKFNYYINNYDLCGCVGCGRCLISCPCNQDIREILQIICEGGCKI